MKSISWILLALVLSAATTSAADAQVYRWVDEDGNVHYTDRPPHLDVERLPIETQPTDLEAVLTERIEDRHLLDESEKDRAHAAAVEDEIAAHEAERAASCRQARDRVAAIESARRLSRVDEDGNRVVYDEQQRAQALAEARRQVADWCD